MNVISRSFTVVEITLKSLILIAGDASYVDSKMHYRIRVGHKIKIRVVSKTWKNMFSYVNYVGVQSWKVADLQTLGIRVEQRGNRVKKRGKKGKMSMLPRPGIEPWPNVCIDKSGPLEDTV